MTQNPISKIYDYGIRHDLEILEQQKPGGPIPTNFNINNEPSAKKRVCSMCKEIDFYSEWHKRWCKEIKESVRLHRKQWEYTAILQAIFERDLLKKGILCLGFAVGTEPLPAIFAKYGLKVTATDLDIAEG